MTNINAPGAQPAPQEAARDPLTVQLLGMAPAAALQFLRQQLQPMNLQQLTEYQAQLQAEIARREAVAAAATDIEHQRTLTRLAQLQGEVSAELGRKSPRGIGTSLGEAASTAGGMALDVARATPGFVATQLSEGLSSAEKLHRYYSEKTRESKWGYAALYGAPLALAAIVYGIFKLANKEPAGRTGVGWWLWRITRNLIVGGLTLTGVVYGAKLWASKVETPPQAAAQPQTTPASAEATAGRPAAGTAPAEGSPAPTPPAEGRGAAPAGAPASQPEDATAPAGSPTAAGTPEAPTPSVSAGGTAANPFDTGPSRPSAQPTTSSSAAGTTGREVAPSARPIASPGTAPARAPAVVSSSAVSARIETPAEAAQRPFLPEVSEGMELVNTPVNVTFENQAFRIHILADGTFRIGNTTYRVQRKLGSGEQAWLGTNQTEVQPQFTSVMRQGNALRFSGSIAYVGGWITKAPKTRPFSNELMNKEAVENILRTHVRQSSSPQLIETTNFRLVPV